MRFQGILVIGAALGMCLLVAQGCKSPAQRTADTKAKYDRVQSGMTTAQVKDILGDPDNVKASGAEVVGVGASVTTMTWKKGQDIVTVDFLNDKVVKKDFSQSSTPEK